jgi:hypothetical protein
MAAEPYCLALVLCDLAHRDAATNKFSILGTFSSYSSPTYPAQVAFCIYYAITDGLGPTTLRFQLVDAESGFLDATDEGSQSGRVFGVKMDIDMESPLVVFEGSIGILAEIPKPGLYVCELWAGSVPLMSRRLAAIEIAKPKEDMP